jgi:hypothetical protein
VHFEQVIRRSELPIRLRRVFPPTLDQLQREFARAAEQGRQPSVFHFLGHGDDDGALNISIFRMSLMPLQFNG